MKSKVWRLLLPVVLILYSMTGCNSLPDVSSAPADPTTSTSASSTSTAAQTEALSTDEIPGLTSAQTTDAYETDAPPTALVTQAPSAEEPAPPTDPLGTTASTAEATTTQPAYEVELSPEEHAPANDKVGLSIYHMAIGEWNELAGDSSMEEAEFINYYSAGSIAEMKAIKEQGGMAWYRITNPYASRDTLEFNDGFEEGILAIAEAYKAAGVWDTLAGFDFEEIGCSVTGDQFIKLTKFLKETFPDKRLFAVLSYYEVVEGSAPAGWQVMPMTYENYGYITDIGYDWYGNNTYEANKELTELMKKQLGRSNVRIWFLPCVYGMFETTTQEYMMTSLETCYRLLKEQENPGGLWLYTFRTFGNTPGLDQLLDPALEGNAFDELKARITEIGHEIIQMDAKKVK